jgi:hypothetical protein
MVESVLGIRNASHMLLQTIYGEFVKSNVLRIVERTALIPQNNKRDGLLYAVLLRKMQSDYLNDNVLASANFGRKLIK